MDVWRNYRAQCWDGYEVPPLPPRWMDSSHGDDVAPSYEKGDCRVWLSHPDPAQRETDFGARYAVVGLCGSEDRTIVDGEPLLVTDDWQAAVDYVENATVFCTERAGDHLDILVTDAVEKLIQELKMDRADLVGNAMTIRAASRELCRALTYGLESRASRREVAP